MYLTLYKSTQKTELPDYNTIMNAEFNEKTHEYYKTTLNISDPTPRNKLNTNTTNYVNKAEQAVEKAWDTLKEFEKTFEQHYYTFQIPKRSGGLRTINAPTANFKNALSTVKSIFERDVKCLAHNSAYAYTQHRSILDALQVHQKNQSNWYLKLDLTDFFTNCTPKLIYTQLKKLFPFYYFDQKHNELLQKIIQVCSLNGGLPQGTPMSPLLTNLVMVPYDYTISNALKRGSGEHFVYTRYADDILISCKSNFEWADLITILEKTLTPFTIKKAKTRYGSKAGSNWNLGLMLNKDNNITLGSSKKRILNAMLNNFIRDFLNNNKWNREDTYALQGQLSWLRHIEPDYYNYIIQKYEAKYNIQDYRELLKQII